ncbi:sulfonate transport system permease protein [Paraburkholderia bannensis]|uniref:Sulfonate transport system permease protein n=1 Tax=Paraburkholderia bannensis TaxID=765414 RepID=A0A7W9TWE3_9BURK|nr:MULTISPECIES: ABC transporter permease [Paraburkholderia]MBB3257250.1 sulfonate transport system permease protein [Paraburkholderia sp. WP4_3_2]MBB6102354.1 sulfonate transport system permease protein [Paraburkholderia bannensis]
MTRPFALAWPTPERSPRPFRALMLLARLAGFAQWWAAPLAIGVLWWVASAHGWISAQLLVSPQRVYDTTLDLWRDGELQQNLGITLHRLAVGFGWGATSGALCGLLLARSRTFADYVQPLFNLLRQVPTLTLIPVLILLIGIDEALKVVIVAKAVFFPIALGTQSGVRDAPRDLIEMARHYGLGRVALLREVLVPAALAAMLTAVRIALARAWLALVAVELLAADSGIGEMMEMARQMLRIDVVLVDVFVIGLIGFALDQALSLAQRWLMRWQ